MTPTAETNMIFRSDGLAGRVADETKSLLTNKRVGLIYR